MKFDGFQLKMFEMITTSFQYKHKRFSLLPYPFCRESWSIFAAASVTLVFGTQMAGSVRVYNIFSISQPKRSQQVKFGEHKGHEKEPALSIQRLWPFWSTYCHTKSAKGGGDLACSKWRLLRPLEVSETQSTEETFFNYLLSPSHFWESKAQLPFFHTALQDIPEGPLLGAW